MYGSTDEESDALVQSGGSSSKNKSKNGGNRVLSIVLLAGLVGVSIYFQSFQTQFQNKLSTDEDKIKHLEEIVEAQGKIIDRFNESVTNTDVIDKLHSMEDRWDTERDELFDQLGQTRADVERELNTTMIKLDATVKDAENVIHEQVDTVKANFDQYVIKTEHQFSIQNNFMIYQVAGTFTILSCLISMWHMGSHSRKMHQPAIQRKVLAILWMCPIYAVTSCLSLIVPAYSGFLGIVKDFYEAYIIYQFLSFCISAIGRGNRSSVIDMLAKQVDHLTPPFRIFFCCCKPHYENDRALASAILLQCQVFAMQFVFWKPATAIAMGLLKKYHYYGPYATDAVDWRSPQFWIVIIQNVSTFVAFTGLLKFYHAVDKELAWCRPFAKFLCIKGVVFMTFWQGSVLTVLAQTTDVGGDSTDEWSESVQNFLICLEMLLFSIAHFYCFPVDEWDPNYKVNFRKAKFGETMALNDFFSDLQIILKGDGKKKKKKSQKPKESTIPEEDDDAETQDDSVSAMDSTVGEEDVKKAFVEALESAEEGEIASEDQQDVHDAGQRIETMLHELSFSARNDVVEEGISSEDKSDNNIENPEENTGLLTGEPATTLTENLRPSIFTSISNVTQEEAKEEEGKKSDGD